MQYFADSPDGAWCEFVRHEEITELDDLAGVRHAMWVVEIGDVTGLHDSALPLTVLQGDVDSYEQCREESRSVRASGAPGMVVPSAAIKPGRAGGLRVEGGLVPGPNADGETVVLFGRRPDVIGWKDAEEARPPVWILESTRHFTSTRSR